MKLEQTNPEAVFNATCEEYEYVCHMKLVVTVPLENTPGIIKRRARFSTTLGHALWTELCINENWKFCLEKQRLVSPGGQITVKLEPADLFKKDIDAILAEMTNAHCI